MIELKTLLIAVHLVGVVLGLGAACIADLYVYRSTIAKSVGQMHVDSVRLMSRIVTVGLGLTLASGLGFIIRYHYTQPEMLLNPKLHAKVLVVLLLTCNAVYIHKIVLPKYCGAFARNLLSSLSFRDLICFTASAAISLSGWWWSFFLGVAKEFNFIYPAKIFLSLYFASSVLAFAAGSIFLLCLKYKQLGLARRCNLVDFAIRRRTLDDSRWPIWRVLGAEKGVSGPVEEHQAAQ